VAPFSKMAYRCTSQPLGFTEGLLQKPWTPSMSAHHMLNSSRRNVVCGAGPEKKPRTVDPVMQGIKDLVEAAAPTLAAISSTAGMPETLALRTLAHQNCSLQAHNLLLTDSKPSTSGRAPAPPVKRSTPSTPHSIPKPQKPSSPSAQQDSWLSPVYLIPLISAAVMAADASQLLPSFSHLALHLGRGFQWWQVVTAGFCSIPGGLP
jgi:hypothetical protein